MRISTSAGIFLSALSIFKKILALGIKTVALFLNTWQGKVFTVGLLILVIYGAWHFYHVALFPVIAGAGARRGLLFVLVACLPSRIRKWIREQLTDLGELMKRKWGATTPMQRLMFKLAVLSIICLVALHYFHVTDILVQVAAILPIPVFVYVYLGEKIPRLISAFVQRQGMGKIVFDGGWQLFPLSWRLKLRYFTKRFILRRVVDARKHVTIRGSAVYARFRRMRVARRKEKLASLSKKFQPASD